MPPAGTGLLARTMALAFRAIGWSGVGGRCSALQKLSATTAFSASESGPVGSGMRPSAAVATWARLCFTVTAATFMSCSVMWPSPWLAKRSPFQVIVVSPMVE